MGVRLRTTLTATAAVAVALCLASIALFAALGSSLSDTTRQLALQDAKERAAAQGFVLDEKSAGVGTPGAPAGAPEGFNGYPGAPGDPGYPGYPPLRAPAAKPGKTGTNGGTDGGNTNGGTTGGTDGGTTGGGTDDSAATAGTTAGSSAGTSEAGAAKDLPPKSASQQAPPGRTKVLLPNSPVVIERVDGKVVTTQVYKKAVGGGPVTVKGFASLAPASQAMRTLTHVLIPGVPALLALVALFTWLAVGRALRPVSAIRAKVADITAHDLHERVPEPRTRDEIAALARTVNATLDRLRTAVDAHRQFVADAAHELRSPMAILRTRLELARPQEKALAAQALDDVARLQALTSDLLLLARLDARRPLRVTELDLAQLVAEEAARKRPRLEVRVTLDLTPDVLVLGSPDHLRRLVANLVDNAVRHATATVAVRLGLRDGRPVLDVEDDGEGIAPEHHATVFDRFTRLDAARPRDTGGSGLGLPIARDIAAAHGATLTIVPARDGSGLPGARLRTVFPPAPREFPPAPPELPPAPDPALSPVAGRPAAR
ncbi:cell wall metabolism sensor histidine kinase WalK [Streptomyces sp. HPF1205]|uniref:sensor histidine kinase n=1 Tax=Streptomyces sp. HPF1205 TaxID=2873262 RepID=UPI001CED3E2E|nr:HAMP domain-containing sensor histidine kinase [Streptomyces sp. HPF1205]